MIKNLVAVQFTSRSACVGGRSAAAETIDKLRIEWAAAYLRRLGILSIWP